MALIGNWLLSWDQCIEISPECTRLVALWFGTIVNFDFGNIAKVWLLNHSACLFYISETWNIVTNVVAVFLTNFVKGWRYLFWFQWMEVWRFAIQFNFNLRYDQQMSRDLDWGVLKHLPGIKLLELFINVDDFNMVQSTLGLRNISKNWKISKMHCYHTV